MKSVTDILKKGTSWILDMIYPPKCLVCDALLAPGEDGCCCECAKKLPFIETPCCLKCGKPISSEEEEYCMDCQNQSHVFTKGVALWSYDERVRQVVYRFKYKNRREYAGYFGKELIKRYERQMKSWEADAVIPVPLHKKRLRKRGFNQAELIAKEAARYIGVPVKPDLAVRIKNTRPQKELNEKERHKNLKSAFKISKNVVKLKRVILVDDIYTTGATVDAIAQLLLKAGIEKVYVVALCIGKGY